jgi:cytochrome bd-type quinol oxidase subunit 1
VTLFVLGMAFTWVMGLMGFIRSSGRLGWHVNEIMRDTSPWSSTPGLGVAAGMVTLNMALFWMLLVGVFWLSRRTLAEAEAPERIWAAADGAPKPTFSPALAEEGLVEDG